MKALADLIFTSDFFYSIFRVATPLLFASMGAVVSDVAGVPNIALEGMMLIAAFAGMYFSYLFGSAWAGLACWRQEFWPSLLCTTKPILS